MSDTITFGTDGWRAIIADQFTFANVERVAYAMGVYVKKTYYQSGKQPPVLIGYDTRFLADKFAQRAGQVLISMGIEVKLSCRDVPTPCIAWATQYEPTAGALQFTASHNPAEYCGVKYIPHFAGPATNEVTAAIASHLNDIPEFYEIKRVPVPTFDPQPPYLEALKKLIDFDRIGKSGLKVGFDALYSVSRDYLDRLLKESGVEVTVLHNWRDPLFGGGVPEPKKECLTELIATVKEKKLDIGIVTDGDADRFSVVDETGEYFSPNQLLCLLTRHLVKNRGQKGGIVRTVATTHLLDLLAEKYELGVPLETPVGFKYVGEEMRKGDILIGGEESGGVSIKGHIPEKDGILANLLIVEMMACEKKPLSVIWKELIQESGISFVLRRDDLDLTIKTQRAVMDHLSTNPPQQLAGEQISRVGRSDGLKLYLDEQNWLLIRPSGTEPLLRLYAECTCPDRADRVLKDFRAEVERVLGELEGKCGAASPSVGVAAAI